MTAGQWPEKKPMWPDHRLVDLLGIEHPLVLAPMAGLGTVELAAAVYVGGGAWLAEPAARELEREFGRPVICNQTAAIREMLKLLNDWTPLQGRGRVMATP